MVVVGVTLDNAMSDMLNVGEDRFMCYSCFNTLVCFSNEAVGNLR